MPARPIAAREGRRGEKERSSTDAAEKFLTLSFCLSLTFFLDEIGFSVKGKMEGAFLLKDVRIKFIRAVTCIS